MPSLWELEIDQIQPPKDPKERDERIEFVIGFFKKLNQQQSKESIYEYVPVENLYEKPVVSQNSAAKMDRELLMLNLAIKPDAQGRPQLVQRWSEDQYEVFTSTKEQSFIDPDSGNVYAVASDVRAQGQAQAGNQYELVIKDGIDQDGYWTMDKIEQYMGGERKQEESVVGLDGYLLTRQGIRVQEQQDNGLYAQVRDDGRRAPPRTFSGSPSAAEFSMQPQFATTGGRGQRSRMPLPTDPDFFRAPSSIVQAPAPSAQPPSQDQQSQQDYFDGIGKILEGKGDRVLRLFSVSDDGVITFNQDSLTVEEKVAVNAVDRGMREAQKKHNPEAVANTFQDILQATNPGSDISKNPAQAREKLEAILKTRGVEEDFGLRSLVSLMSEAYKLTDETQRAAATDKIIASFGSFMGDKAKMKENYSDAEEYNKRVQAASCDLCGLNPTKKSEFSKELQESLSHALESDWKEFYGKKGVPLVKKEQEDKTYKDVLEEQESLDAQQDSDAEIAAKKSAASAEKGDGQGISAGQVGIVAFKAAVVVGLAAGAPGVGLVAAAIFLYASRNWGVPKEKNQKDLEEAKREMEILQMRDQMRSRENMALARKAREGKAPGELPEGENLSQAPLTNLGSTVAAVGSKMHEDLDQTKGDLSRQSAILRTPTAPAPSQEVSVAPSREVPAPSQQISADKPQSVAPERSDSASNEVDAKLNVSTQAPSQPIYDNVSTHANPRSDSSIQPVYELATKEEEVSVSTASLSPAQAAIKEAQDRQKELAEKAREEQIRRLKESPLHMEAGHVVEEMRNYNVSGDESAGIDSSANASLPKPVTVGSNVNEHQ